MRKLLSRTYLAFMLLALAGTADAADGEGNFAVKGVGTTNCRDYLRARQAGGATYTLYGGYIGGYVTAYNQFQPKTFDIVPWQSVDTLTRMLASFCQKSPNSLFAAVLSRLAKVLEAERIDRKSPLVHTGTADNDVPIYAEALRRTQAKLAGFGLYKGNPDGSFDAGTRKALAGFQQSNGLPVTGLPDQATLFVLSYPPSGGH